jgi:hypothetical protein
MNCRQAISLRPFRGITREWTPVAAYVASLVNEPHVVGDCRQAISLCPFRASLVNEPLMVGDVGVLPGCIGSSD